MRPSRYAFPAALLCAAGLSIGLCFCVITSFAVPVDPVRLLLACFLAAALFSAVFLLPGFALGGAMIYRERLICSTKQGGVS